MKQKTIEKVIAKKIDSWIQTLPEEIRKQVLNDVIVTGGCIVSMLQKERVNDFDVYFNSLGAAELVAEHICKQVNATFTVDDTTAPKGIKITVPSKGIIDKVDDPEEFIEDLVEEKDEAHNYEPIFVSTNAVTLKGKIQLIFRFIGAPEEIHSMYDFVHCSCYWTAATGLVCNEKALLSILTKELVYQGSKFPVCSIFRLRKFIARGWTINAGQVLKIIMQINDLNLLDIAVLEDQLTGVDVTYFQILIDQLKEQETVMTSSKYLMTVLERVFDV